MHNKMESTLMKFTIAEIITATKHKFSLKSKV